jgi:hypothetical protein
MDDAEIRKNPDRVEGVTECLSLEENTRVPEPVGRSASTGRAAVRARAPGPLHSIAWVDLHDIRGEAQAIIANRHRDCGAACRAGVESHKWSDSHHHCSQPE